MPTPCKVCGKTWHDNPHTALQHRVSGGVPVVGEPVTHIRLSHNGDPFGSGFTGTLQAGRDARYGVYMGDKGAQTRAWWRAYARTHGYKLVEAE